MPDVGILVIEVKDWRLVEMTNVTADVVAINRRGRSETVQHPRKQARGYMLRMMDECRRHPQASKLMQGGDRYSGGFAFPFCHITVLSNINRSQIEREAPELTRLFPPGVTITRDEIAGWEQADPVALRATLKACFDPRWPFPKMTPPQVDIIAPLTIDIADERLAAIVAKVSGYDWSQLPDVGGWSAGVGIADLKRLVAY